MFPADWLRETARRTGLIKRARKIDPVALFWILALAYGVEMQRTLASLKRNYEERTDQTLSDGSWYDRFTPELVKFLHACVLRGMEQLALEVHRPLGEKLSRFQDLLIQDSTVFRLHAKLAKRWPAVRTRVLAAGVKVATLISVVANGPKSLAIHSESTSEYQTLRIGKWLKDRILLFDLGFYSFQTFARIEENGGFFVSRVKEGADLTLLRSLTVHRGRAIDLAGKKWNDLLEKLRREVVDAEVEVKVKRRAYRGHRTMEPHRFRLVAVYNEEARRYHVYLTNIPPDVLTAEEIASLYGCRWEIELVFKELKSRYALDKIKTTNPQVVEALIWVSCLTMIISRTVYNMFRRVLPPEQIIRFTQMRWANSFVRFANRHLASILAYCGIEETMELHMEILSSQVLDPHVNRERFREGYTA